MGKIGKKKIICIIALFILTAVLLFFRALIVMDDSWEITEYSDDSGNQAMFYTFYQKKTDSLLVIDGGWSENTQHVRDVINSYGGVVTAWFITHYHNDHVGAFNEIYADPQGIEIKKVYDSPAPLEECQAVAHSWDAIEYQEQYVKLTADADNVEHLAQDEKIEFDNLTCTVFNTYDDDWNEIDAGDLCNNLSLVLKFESSKNSFLMCADCHGENMSRYLIDHYGDQLKSDYVQLGHHGNNSLTNEFYDTVNPSAAFFDGPEWLMTGEDYDAKERKEYFEGKGVRCFDFTTAPNKVTMK